MQRHIKDISRKRGRWRTGKEEGGIDLTNYNQSYWCNHLVILLDFLEKSKYSSGYLFCFTETYVTWSYLRQTYIYLPSLKAKSPKSQKVLQICVNSVWTELQNKIRWGIIQDFFLQVVTFCQDSRKTTHNKNTCFKTSLDSCFPRLIFLVSVSGCSSSLIGDPTSACNGLDCIPCALLPTGFLFTGKAVVGCGRKSKPTR